MSHSKPLSVKLKLRPNQILTFLFDVSFASCPDLHPVPKRIMMDVLGLETMTEIQSRTFAAAALGINVLGRAWTSTKNPNFIIAHGSPLHESTCIQRLARLWQCETGSFSPQLHRLSDLTWRCYKIFDNNNIEGRFHASIWNLTYGHYLFEIVCAIPHAWVDTKLDY